MTRVLTYMENWTSWKTAPSQGVVKRDWVPTGRIDFATRLNGTLEDSDQPSEFKLLSKSAGLSRVLRETKIWKFNGDLRR